MRKILYGILVCTLVLSGCSSKAPANISTTGNLSLNITAPVNVIVSNATSTVNSTMFGKVEGNGLQTPLIDKLTGAMIYIEQTHNEVHEGEMYSWCNITTLASGANTTVLFTTPNSSFGNVHMEFIVQSTYETEWMIHEGSNITVVGTNQTAEIVNRNRLFTDTPHSLLFGNPTVTSYGKNLCMKHWGSGRGVGGETIAENEIVFKPSTNYTFVATSFANGDVVSIELVWYLQVSMY